MNARKTPLPEPTVGVLPRLAFSLPFQGKRVRLTKAAKRRYADGHGLGSSAGHVREYAAFRGREDRPRALGQHVSSLSQ